MNIVLTCVTHALLVAVHFAAEKRYLKINREAGKYFRLLRRTWEYIEG